ncbi:MAG: hypothetical protein HRT47_10580 [Candidatus Caenarcaniphilales bacterium]|nr:hypothetical protein [Candidatus Caenarcaniphilales bacterium]
MTQTNIYSFKPQIPSRITSRYSLPRSEKNYDPFGLIQSVSAENLDLKIFYAFSRPDYGEIEKILDENINFKIKNERGQSTFMLMLGNFDSGDDRYDQLLNRAFNKLEDFNQVDDDGNNLIFYAVKGGAIEFLEPLLGKISLAKKSENIKGLNPLDYAYEIIREGVFNPDLYKETAKKLLELGFNKEKIYQAKFQNLDKVILFDDLNAFKTHMIC